jgi:hypothetical protein
MVGAAGLCFLSLIPQLSRDSRGAGAAITLAVGEVDCAQTKTGPYYARRRPLSRPHHQRRPDVEPVAAAPQAPAVRIQSVGQT